MLESDISFVSNGRPSIERTYPPRSSNFSDIIDYSFESPRKSVGAHSSFGSGFSSMSCENVTSNSQSIMVSTIKQKVKKCSKQLLFDRVFDATRRMKKWKLRSDD